jgi:hypothetical protein
MKNRLVILFLVLLTIVNVSALVTIAYHRLDFRRLPPPIEQPDMHMNPIKQELGLNDEQVKEFDSQAQSFHKEIEPILDSLQAKRSDLMSEITAKEPSMGKLNRLADEIGALQAELEKRTTMHFLKGKSFLTPDQQRRFFSLLKERGDRIRMMRGRGRELGK